MNGDGDTTVAVIGAGAAGTLAVAHLADAAVRHQGRIEIALIDPKPEIGRGCAYSTTDPRHLLNVPCARMSAWPHDPDHFLRWLRGQGRPATAEDFVPRTLYGAYLAEVIGAAVAAADGRVRLRRIMDRAVGIDRVLGLARVRLASGAGVAAHRVVLAIGNQPPGTNWAPPELLASHRFIADPWAGDLAARLDDTAPVLLVGTGLTMVDVALSLLDRERTVHAVSRNGLLPRAHRTGPPPGMPPPVIPRHPPDAPLRLAQLRRIVADHVRASIAEYRDWRPAIDSLRPIIPELWQALPATDRAEFLSRDAARWETHRHRMAPQVARAVATARQAGRLQVGRGEVAAVEAAGDGLRVWLSDGRALHVGWVVNCTGPTRDLSACADPLPAALIDSGQARPDELGLGLATDLDGRVMDRLGIPSGTIWTLGSARRGRLWESTAVPELREQAAALAARLVNDPAPRSNRPGHGPTPPRQHRGVRVQAPLGRTHAVLPRSTLDDTEATLEAHDARNPVRQPL